MTEKIIAYLDNLFATLPDEPGVKEAREELQAGMLERYNDYLREGMDEQAAYDAVIDSVGDIKELFDELNTGAGGADSAATEGHPYGDNTQQQWNEGQNDGWQQNNTGSWQQQSRDFFGKDFSDGLNELVHGITEMANGLVRGVQDTFDTSARGDLPLQNSQSIPLQDISSIEVGYISETIYLGFSPDETLVVNEYFKHGANPSVFANIQVRGGCISIKHGNRFPLWWPSNRVEILLPASWQGSLSLSTLSGSIHSDGVWQLSSLQVKTVSGQVKLVDVSAGMLRVQNTSGSIQLGHAAGNMALSTVSGSIKVENAEGGGTFKTTSGSIRVYFTRLAAPVEAVSVSGGVRLGLPASASFELDARSVSGSIHTAFDEALRFDTRSRASGFFGQPPHHTVRISTTSGGIHIND